MPDPTQPPCPAPDPHLPSPSGEFSQGWETFFSRFSLWFFILIVTVESFTLFFTRADEYPYGAISGSDGQCYYAFLRSSWIDHDLNFENEFGELNYLGHGRDTLLHFPRSPKTGLLFNMFPVGFPIFHLPFFATAHVLTWLGNQAGIWQLALDGYSLPYQFAVLIGAIFWGACAFASTQRLLNRYFSPGLSSLTTFLFFLAFQGLFQIIRFPCNPHLQSLLIFNLLLMLGFKVQDRQDTLRTWASLGLCVGILSLLRIECGVVLAYPAVLLLWKTVSQYKTTGQIPPHAWRSCAGVGLVVGTAFLIGFFPQILMWRLMWGDWLREGLQVDVGFHWTTPLLLETLFSTFRGLFYWTPIAFLGCLGLGWLLRSSRVGIALRGAIVPLLILWYVYSCWPIGYSYGARRFIVVSTLFAFGYASLIERFPGYRFLTVGIGFLLAAWNHILIYLYLNGHVPRTTGFNPLLPFFKFIELCKRLF
jgi:hypothetical protein